MRRSFQKLTLFAALVITIAILAVPRSAAAYQHDDDDHRSQAQDQSQRDDDGRQQQGARDNQGMDQDRSYGMQRNDGQQRNLASDYGYQDGVTQGMHDRQSGRRARPTDDANYKQADRGYESKFGDHDQYRQMYRQAYERGYDRGYNGNGYNQQDRVNDRDRRDQGRRDNADRRDNDDHH
jgi:hypothetical protein